MRKNISILTLLLFLSIIFSIGTTQVKADDKSYEMMKSYYEVINTIVNGDKKDNKGIGIYIPDKKNPREASGLVYTNLIDFDGDGNKELFCFYLLRGNYVYEVWGFNGKAYKINSAKKSTFCPLRENEVLNLLTVDNKTYVHLSDKSWGRGASIGQIITGDVFYTVKNNKWVEAESLNSKPKLTDEYINSFEAKGIEPPQLGTEGNPIIYTVTKDSTNKELTKSEYEKVLQKYAGGTKTDLISLGLGGAGTVEIGVDLSKGDKEPVDFCSSLSGKVMESLGLKDVYNTKTGEYKMTLTEFMNNFIPGKGWHVDSFDEKNFNKGTFDDQIIFYLYRYGSIEKDITGVKTETNSDTGKECWVLPLDKLNGYCEKLFGMKIDANNKNIRNGNYYLYKGNDDEGEETGRVANKIVSLYQIEDNIYCLNLKTFCSYSYGKFYKTGYAIVKEVEVDGKKTFQLLKYNSNGDMLTKEQIQSYKKQVKPESKVANNNASVDTMANKNISNNSTSVVIYCGIAVVSIVGICWVIYYKSKRNKKDLNQ